MTRRYYLDDVELTSVTVTGLPRADQLPGLVSSAFGGAIGMSSIQIDDPTGTVTITGYQRFRVEDDACTPPIIWIGYISSRKVSLADLIEASGVGRVWDCDLMDLNFLAGLRVIHGAGTKRVAEYDDVRVAWLLTRLEMTEAGPGIFDNGFVSTSHVRFQDEADFLKDYPATVLDSCLAGEQTWFVYWDPSATTGEEVSLYYGPHATGFGTLTVKLSNDLADIDSSTIFATLSGEQLVRSPEDQNDGLLYIYKGVPIYRQSAATFAAMGIHRDFVIETDRVGLAATAEAQAAQYLDTHGTERDQITCTVHLADDQVNWFLEGWRVDCKFTHLPGYDDYVSMMIERRTVALAPNKYNRYEVQLELTSVAPEGNPGGGDPGDFPHPPATPPGLVQEKYDVGASRSTVTLDAAPAEGNLLVVWMTQRGNPAPTVTPAGWTLHPSGVQHAYGTDYSRMIYRVAAAGESATVTVRDALTEAGTVQEITLAEFTGVAVTADADSAVNVSTSTLPGTVNAGTITPTASQSVLLIAGLCVGVSDYPSDIHSFITPGSSFTELEDHMTDQSGTGENFHPLHWFGYRLVDPTSGGYATAQTLGGGTLNYLGNSGEALAFVSAAEANPPAPGQWVYGETVEMSGTSGTTAFPYAAGSLKVRVDGVLISPASYTETNPTTGAFDLAWTTDTDETVTVDYQGI